MEMDILMGMGRGRAERIWKESVSMAKQTTNDLKVGS